MEDYNVDVIKKIQSEYPNLSKGHKIIADYIVNSFEKAAFQTASNLGKSVSISESTVVRFATELGFKGYPELQKNLQNIVKNRLTSVQRIELSKDILNDNDIFNTILKTDIENIKSTMEKTDKNNFENIVNEIYSAKKIYILGLRVSSVLAEFLAYYLNIILENVEIINYGINDVLERVISINEGDLLIAIGFPRYANRTLDIMDHLKSKNVKIVALTDSITSPLAIKADYTLTAECKMTSFVDSISAPFSVVTALINAIGLREEEKTSRKYGELEKLWEEFNIY